MAKKFFYVSAGLLLLALTYHLGARSATAQGSTQAFGAIESANAVVTTGAMLHGVHLNAITGIDSPPTSILLPHPGTVIAATASVSSSTPSSIGLAFVIYEDGSLWHYRSETGWVLVTSMIGGGPTAGSPTTWGRVKAEYRK